MAIEKGLTIAKNLNIEEQVYGLDSLTARCLEFSEIIHFLNRLGRFEYPVKKNTYISNSILFKTTVSPKINRKKYNELLPGTISSAVCCIWNQSLQNAPQESNVNELLNLYLAYEETRLFSATECLKETLLSGNIVHLEHPISINMFTNFSQKDKHGIEQLETLLKSNSFQTETSYDDYLQDVSIFERLYIAYKMTYPINIKGALDLVKNLSEDDLTPNIRRLLFLEENITKIADKIDKKDFLNTLFQSNAPLRRVLNVAMPPRLILLVEGVTEELLLPKFASLLGLNFNTDGIHIIPAGGKTQVYKLYKKYKKQITLPIVILLDADAEEIYQTMLTDLRPKDKMLTIKQGEFEDLLPIELICNIFNSSITLTDNINPSDIDETQPRVKELSLLWKNLGLGSFNKSTFASIIADNIQDAAFVSPEVRTILKEIYTQL